METLGVKTAWGITEPIQSNDFPICLRCSTRITKDNNSGWEGFTKDGRTTQAICIECDNKAALDIGIKEE